MATKLGRDGDLRCLWTVRHECAKRDQPQLRARGRILEICRCDATRGRLASRPSSIPPTIGGSGVCSSRLYSTAAVFFVYLVVTVGCQLSGVQRAGLPGYGSFWIVGQRDWGVAGTGGLCLARHCPDLRAPSGRLTPGKRDGWPLLGAGLSGGAERRPVRSPFSLLDPWSRSGGTPRPRVRVLSGLASRRCLRTGHGHSRETRRKLRRACLPGGRRPGGVGLTVISTPVSRITVRFRPDPILASGENATRRQRANSC
jgi:hypothetical protein